MAVRVQQAIRSVFDPWVKAALMRVPVRQRRVVALRLLRDLDTRRTADAPEHEFPRQ